MPTKVPWYRERFQTVSRSISAGRNFNGKHYERYGATDDKSKGKERAKKHYKYVRVVKMPKTIRKVDPESAKYLIYARGRKTPRKTSGGKRRRK